MITLYQFEASPFCDKVRRICHVKNLPYQVQEVSLLGAQALQQGRVGDTIRVKNPQSGKTVTGRVVDASTVEIRL